MIKRFFALSVLCTSILLAGCSDDNVNHPIATIGETEITENEFYEQLKKSVGKDILKQMTLDVLLNKYYNVTDSEIEEIRSMTMHSQGLDSDQELVDYLKESEMTLQSFEENIRTTLLIDKASVDGVEIPLEDLRVTYEVLKTKVRANHILVKDLKTAADILQKFEEGEEFPQLAKTYSLDNTTNMKGGDLGYFSEGFFDEKLVNAAFSLGIGEVSEPIRTDFGYHLIQTTDKNRSFDDMKKDIEELLLAKRKKTINDIFEDLSAKEKITIHDSDLNDAFLISD